MAVSGKRRKAKKKRTVVLCLGNLLLKDEGFGVHAYRAIRRRRDWPRGIAVFEAGTAALDALELLGKIDHLVVIDAVRGGGRPGDIYRFAPNDVRSSGKVQTSLHQLGFLESLEMAAKIGCAPKKVTIIGVEPREISSGLELTPELAARLPRVLRLALKVARGGLKKHA